MVLHIILTSLLLVVATESRQMCYTCQYTITSTKQGIECADTYNGTADLIHCPYACVITSTRMSKPSEALRSFYRGCNEGTKSGCEDINGMFSCTFSCTNDKCNSLSIEDLEKKFSEKNGANIINIKNSLILITILFTTLNLFALP
ncbi:hypothetical protein Ahia01_000655900 [Argonauta hians]